MEGQNKQGPRVYGCSRRLYKGLEGLVWSWRVQKGHIWSWRVWADMQGLGRVQWGLGWTWVYGDSKRLQDGLGGLGEIQEGLEGSWRALAH